ncbi:MAG: hypothetical protein OEQ47_12320, partial [Acidimicrobiia bacterium]|nr:hypothetical protein [Acidimicrobiia bacterium]
AASWGDDDGDEFLTVALVSVDDPDLTQSDFDNIVRVLVGPSAVEEDGGGLDNVPNAYDVKSSGASSSPYLTNIEVTDAEDGDVDFTFSEAIVDFDNSAGDFHLVLSDGTLISAGDADRDSTDSKVVNATFGALADEVIVYGVYYSDGSDEVEDTTGPAAPDSVAVSTTFASGETVGPDLISSVGSKVGLDDESYLVTLTFDEDLDDPNAFVVGDLLGYKADGTEVALSGGAVDDIDGATIEILFTGGAGTDELVEGEIVLFGWEDSLFDDVLDQTGYPDSIGCDCAK